MLDSVEIPPVASARVLIADDELAVLSLFGDALRDVGYEVATVCDGLQLYQTLGFFDERPGQFPPFDIVITDIRMPGVTGIEALQGIAMIWPRLPIIVISSFVDRAMREAANCYRAAGVFQKPVGMPALISAVRAALGRDGNT